MFKFLPLFLLWVTVTSDWNFSFSTWDYAQVWDPAINAATSLLKIVMWFAQYYRPILAIAVLLWVVGAFFKFWKHK